MKPTVKTARKIQPGKVIPICLLLFGVVVWTFLPSLHGGFIDFDDFAYVTGNSHINFTPGNLARALAHGEAGYWHPLTMWSVMLDHQLYGLNPWGYHLTNVLLHAVNTVLLFLVLRRMTGALWRSLMVAGLFGLHPLRVESVAWICERKDVLSVLFWLLTLWAYVRYAQRRSSVEPSSLCSNAPRSRASFAGSSRLAFDPRRWPLDYGLALVFFALGLMSKPMVVTLPFVLLLLDYWPLARWSRQNMCVLVVEKAPFFLLSAIFCVVTYVVQKSFGMLKELASVSAPLSFSARLDNALVAYGRYLGKLFWPVNLCAFYPHPGHWPAKPVVLAGLLILSISVFACVVWRRWPYCLTGWFWYLGTLVPAIGLVQVGSQSMADRFSYIPSVGILLVLVWGAHQIMKRWNHRGILLGTAGGALVLACILLTRYQIGFWKDGVCVWQRTIAVTENNYDAHNRLARAWFSQGRLDEAIRGFQEAVRLNPHFAEAYVGLGRSFAASKRVDEAIACYQKALEIQPDYIVAHIDLSDILSRNGQVDAAIVHCQKALEIEPNNATAYNNLGFALFQKGNVDEAIVLYQKALQINPDHAEAHNNLGTALFQKGNVDEAIVHFRKALQTNPDHAEAHNNLGTALFQKGSMDEAIVHLQKALLIKPDLAEADYYLGAALNSQGRFDEAIACFQTALEIIPKMAEAHYNLGFALYSTGRLDEAIRELQETLRLKPDYTEASNNLVNILKLKEKQAGKPTNSSVP